MALHLAATLPDKLRGRVLEYVPLEGDEQLRMVYDTTVLGSARAGLVITDRRFVVYDKDAATALRLADVTSIDLAPEHAGAFTLRVRGPADAATITLPVYLDATGLEVICSVLNGFARPDLIVNAPALPPSTPRWLMNVNRGRYGVLLSTTEAIEGCGVDAYLGVVSGEAVTGSAILVDVAAGMRDVFGGRSRALEDTFADARETAFQILEEAAARLGANGVIAIDVDYEAVGGRGSMFMVSVNGTAVRLVPVVLAGPNPGVANELAARRPTSLTWLRGECPRKPVIGVASTCHERHACGRADTRASGPARGVRRGAHAWTGTRRVEVVPTEQHSERNAQRVAGPDSTTACVSVDAGNCAGASRSAHTRSARQLAIGLAAAGTTSSTSW
jgi:uncharacterized protein YbjQ (UPF0145 family)